MNKIVDDIKVKIRSWIHQLYQNEKIPDDIIALNFGIQKVFDSYQIYQSGHDDYYENHDTWLISEKYSPSINFVGLGKESLTLDRSEIFKIYKNELTYLIESEELEFPDQVKDYGLIC